MELFLLLLHFQSKNFFYKMFETFTNEFKTNFEYRKWIYQNRKWNYFYYLFTYSKNIFYHVLIRRASLTIMFYSLKIVIIWNKIVRPLVIINLWLAKHCVMFYSSFFSLIFSICTRPCTPAQYPLTLPGQGGGPPQLYHARPRVKWITWWPVDVYW